MHGITQQNLETAMRDEAFMFARYMLYGRVARTHRHTDVADLFESLADVEAFDYFMHEADLAGLASQSDVENLQAAIAVEAAEEADTYRVFELQARDAGESSAEAQFARIRADKRRRLTELALALERLEQAAPHKHRLLVIADAACHGSGLCDEVAYRAGRVPSDVLIVAPALTRSRLHYLASDLDHEAAEARERMEELQTRLAEVGVHASARVGDASPLIAIDDALREFHADEIVIATVPPDQSTWLEHSLVHDARERFAPRLITHVVVDPTADRGAIGVGD